MFSNRKMDTAEEKNFRIILRRNILLPLALSTVSAACFVAVVLFLLRTNEWVSHSDQIIASTNQLLKLTIDSETGLRGYLLTGSPEFLEPHTNALKESPRLMKDLQTLVSDSPSQQARLVTIEKRYAEWTAFSEVRKQSREKSARSATDLQSARRAKAMMDDIRAGYSEFLSFEESFRQDRKRSAGSTAQWTIILIVLFSTMFGALLALFGRKQLLTLSAQFAESLRRQTEQSADLEQKAWLAAAQSKLQDEVRGNLSVGEVSQKALNSICRYVGAEVGRLFILKNERTLHIAANFAFDERLSKMPSQFDLGQGLIGQCARDQKTTEFSGLPTDYLQISSSTGSVSVEYVIASPLIFEGSLKGVFELGFRHKPDDRVREMLQGSAERIAYAVNAAEYRTQLRDLLEETQRQAEELQTQQEELEKNNEDLQQKSQELMAQQHNLEQANSELEQQQTVLEEQKQRLEESNLDLERAQGDIQEKARGLEVASQYKSEFLANMSHELRTPLNSILLLANLLFENSRQALNAEEIEYATTIHSSATDLLNLINDILDLSKVEAGKLDISPETVLLKEFCESARRIFDPLANKRKLEFKVRVDDDAVPSIITDRTRTDQIIRNLLSNAIKFTEHGQVELRMSKPTGNYNSFGLAIHVSDTGIGIPPEKQALVFDAFKQADGTISRKFGGTGLGLTICRELSHLLGGQITLRSEVGKGTTFTLYLPHSLGGERLSAEPMAATPAPTLTYQPESPLPEQVSEPSDALKTFGIVDDRAELKHGDRVILIIEDDPAFAKILFSLCKKKGFRCLLAGNGEQGVADATSYLPLAIVLDIRLPGLSGLGVLERLKRNPATRHIPIHAVSVEDRGKDALQLGAIGFASKPASAEALEKVFERLTVHAVQESKSILLIEDNPIELQNLKRLIGNANIDIVGVSNGADALSELERRLFDCIILDLKLPDVSGFEVIARLKDTKNVGTPVIIYTARELTREEKDKLSEYSDSIVIKGARSPERLLDEVTLFLHQMEDRLSPVQKEMLQKVRHREDVFQDKFALVVDDDMRNVFALRSVLLKKGFKVAIAKTGKEALERLSEIGKVDVILMDVMMPEMDGYEAMKRIRKDEQYQSTAIIALTAKAMKGDREKCFAAGASDYLPKPIDMNSLLSLLRIWLTR